MHIEIKDIIVIRDRLKLIGVIALWLLFSQACTTVDIQRAPTTLDPQARWVLLPIVNFTQTPQAGLRAEAIVESLVRSRGVWDLQRYPSKLNSESLFEPAERNAVEKAMQWAQKLEVDYAITGTVDEWRYKVGVDGEPAVGFSLQLIEVRTGRVVWSAVGSKTGWSREALSAVAQKLLRQLTGPLAVVQSAKPVAKKKQEKSGSTKSAAQAESTEPNPVKKPVGTPTSKSVAEQAPAPSRYRPRVRLAPEPEQPQTSDSGSGLKKVPTRKKLPFPHRTPRPVKSGG
jgi:TolB-like protein